MYAYSPWMPGHPKPEFFIPTWYFLVFAWFVGCNWYAHRCTVYDNLLKDQVAQQILTPKPKPDVKEGYAKPQSPARVPTTVPAPEPTPKKETPVVQERTTKASPGEVASPATPKPKVRSADAESTLAKLRQKWLKDGSGT